MAFSFLTALPLVVCLVMTAELLLSCRRGCPSPLRWLTAWSGAATLLYAGHYAYFHRALSLMPFSDTVYAACNLAVYPLYILYISEHTDLRPLSSRRWAVSLLLLPSAVALIVVGTVYALMTPDAQTLFVVRYLYGGTGDGLAGLPLVQAWVHSCCHAVFAVEVVAVLAAGVVKLRRYNNMVDSYFADTDDKRLTHLTTTLVWFVLVSAASIVANYLGRESFTASATLLAVPSLLFSALLFFIGWTGRQPHTLLRDMLPSATDGPDAASDQCTDTATQCAADESTAGEENQPATAADSTLGEQLQRLMTDEQLYLQHDLRLDQVAQRLATNRTYLLRTLQKEFGMTFKEYINQMRIAHADRLMEADPSLPKSEVAIMSGYNTTSSFYRNYRQYHKPDTP